METDLTIVGIKRGLETKYGERDLVICLIPSQGGEGYETALEWTAPGLVPSARSYPASYRVQYAIVPGRRPVLASAAPAPTRG